MSLAPGNRLGPFEVMGSLGAGGMGEVYRARDTKLNRDVAIKVLTSEFATDPERLARFRREAKVLASLNHPNIAAIHGFEDSTDTLALVLELVPGPTLQDRIAQGAIPLDEALPIAKQIAEALEAAHEQGIIHRDLKPANIKVTPDGVVKVLDFGLAKALEPERSETDAANSPTMTHLRDGYGGQAMSAAATRAGFILGTAGYMSPEQARGKPVDRRADIWALGAVLFEMLTGRRAFEGDDVSTTLAAVLKDDVDWTALPGSTPRALRRLIRRCLTKDPKARLRDAGDLRIEIDEILSGAAADTEVLSGSTPQRSGLRAGGTAAALVAVAALAGTVPWWLKPAAADIPLRKFSIQAADGARIQSATISPDGQSIAFIVGDTLWVRRLDTLVARDFPGVSEVHEVFWSPDSAMVGFEAQTQLWKVAATGGVPQPIGRVPDGFSSSSGAIWLPDDRIVFTTGGSGLLEVSALGGEPRPFLDVDVERDQDFHNVSALPGRRGFLFVPHPLAGPRDSIDLFDGTARRTVLRPGGGGIPGHPAYAPSGHLLYSSEGAIWAVPFALKRGEVTGEPFRVAASGRQPSVSEDGTLAFVAEHGGHEALELAWVGSGAELIEVVRSRGHRLFDMRRLGGTSRFVGGRDMESGASELWVVDSANGTERRLTYEPGVNSEPVWSSDGTHVVYRCEPGICSRPSDGSGQPVVLVPAPAGRPELSPDDAILLFRRGNDIFKVALGAAGVTAPPVAEPEPFVATDGTEFMVAVSPSGAHAAYQSNESGSSMVYITAFPSGLGKWPVGRGELPRWSPTGDRLYYVTDGNSMAAVDVTTTPALSLSEPRAVLSAPGIEFNHGFEPSADGSRFLVNRSADIEAGTTVTVVQNWIAEFTPRRRGER